MIVGLSSTPHPIPPPFVGPKGGALVAPRSVSTPPRDGLVIAFPRVLRGTRATALPAHGQRKVRPRRVFMDSGDDVQLVGRCLRGEVDAFEPLVARYQKVLYNVALRLLGDREDARDVTQSAFAKAYEKLHTYDPSYRFFSWIYRIALNESLNLKHRRPIMTPLDERLATRDTPFDQAFAHEMSERIQAALLKLPPENREVVVLRHFGELCYADIAAALGVPEKTVKSRLYTARQRLAEILLSLGTVQ